MKKIIRKQSKGFTLIELLIYMSISTAAILVFTSFMVDVTKSAARAKTAKEVQQNARLLLERLTQEIRTAKTIPIPSVGQTTNEISLINIAGDTITYCLSDSDNAVHYLTNEANCSSAPLLSNDQVRVTQLNITESSNTYTVGLTVEQRNQNPSASEKSKINLSSTIVPRSLLY